MLIGITGYAQHGKDSSGDVLVKEYGFTKYAFANQLKELALEINPYVDSEYTTRLYQLVQDQGWEEAKKNPEVRRFLQVLGTSVRDIVGEDAWIRALVTQMTADGNWDRQGPGYGAAVVITDVRFPNEAEFIHKFGGELWRVKRFVIRDDPETWDTQVLPYDNRIGVEHLSEKLVSSLPADRVIEAVSLSTLQASVMAIMNDNDVGELSR